MNDRLFTLNERLHLGIEAARAGQNNLARDHLLAVLKHDPNHIAALLWLAFVLPSPRESIRVLEQALALDPQNEQAKVGLHWARGRLGLNPDAPDLDKGPTPSVSPQTVPVPNPDTVRQNLPSRTAPKEAGRRGLVRQARYVINPLLTLILAAVLGLVALGLGALIFVPPDTLAAWLPVSTPAVEADIAPIPAANPTLSSVPIIKSFASETDTILLTAPQPLQTNTTAPDLSIELAAAESSLAESPPASPAETSPTSVEPSLLIGPELSLTSVDRSQLAHQPTYSGEKWIEVNVTTQQVTAWEGDTPVMSFVASTGLPQTPTVLGEFNIYWKLESTTMSGPGYYLPDVPYTMYFYEGYALHGTYWHSSFGQSMSRGCVNLPTDNAKQLFEWAGPIIPPNQTEVEATHENPGTLVVVHE